MIGPGTGVRVYLACGVTDLRNYVARLIMRSPRRRLGVRRRVQGVSTSHNAERF